MIIIEVIEVSFMMRIHQTKRELKIKWKMKTLNLKPKEAFTAKLSQPKPPAQHLITCA